MNFAIFARPVVTIYDLTETTKESDAGVVSTIGDEGLYGQVCPKRPPTTAGRWSGSWMAGPAMSGLWRWNRCAFR